MKNIVGINFLSHTKANDTVQTLLEDTGNGRILVKVELGTKTCVEADLKWGSCSQCGEVIITDHRGRTLSLSGAAPPRPGPCLLLLSKHSVSSPAPPTPHLSTDQLAAAGLRDHQQSATCGASSRHFITNTSIMNCSFRVSIQMLYFRTIK